MLTDKQVAYVELHDARLMNIVLTPGSKVIFDFDVITVYYVTAKPDVFEVWRVQGRLLCDGVSRFSVTDPFDEPYVSDVAFEDLNGKTLDSIGHGANVAVKSVRIVIDGCNIAASLSQARLDLVKEQEREGDWIGPLTGS